MLTWTRCALKAVVEVFDCQTHLRCSRIMQKVPQLSQLHQMPTQTPWHILRH